LRPESRTNQVPNHTMRTFQGIKLGSSCRSSLNQAQSLQIRQAFRGGQIVDPDKPLNLSARHRRGGFLQCPQDRDLPRGTKETFQAYA